MKWKQDENGVWVSGDYAVYVRDDGKCEARYKGLLLNMFMYDDNSVEEAKYWCGTHSYQEARELVGVTEEGDDIHITRHLNPDDLHTGDEAYYVLPGTPDEDVLERHLCHVFCQIQDTENELNNLKEEAKRIRIAMNAASTREDEG